MQRLVLPLAAVRQPDTALVGGKASALGSLRAEGFPVPDGFCVTTEAFRLALADHQPEIAALLSAVEHDNHPATQTIAGKVAHLLAGLTIPAPIVTALQTCLSQSFQQAPVATTGGTDWLAVRSSAIGEDGATVSFAGHYATTLGVAGLDALQAAILTCWRSYFSPAALAARVAQGSIDVVDGMAVLIQPLIAAECAGVCFSVDPVRQRRDIMVVNAAWGLGPGVVDGSVPSDTYWIQRHDLQVDRSDIVEKNAQMVVADSGELSRAIVPKSMQRAVSLPPEWLARVTQFAIAAERHLGSPQDVEWAIADDEIWILQSRPITGLSTHLQKIAHFPVTWSSQEERQSLWRRDDDGLTPEVLLPLELDLFAQVASVREEACRLLGVERNQRYKYCNGRIYFQPIPMLWSAGDRRVRRAAMQDLRARLHRDGQTPWDYWGPEIVQATERLRVFIHEKNSEDVDGVALAEHLEDALAVRRRHNMLHPACSFKPPPAYFDAYRTVVGSAATDADAATEATAYRLLDAGETPLSQLVDHLYALACVARQEDQVAALLIQGHPDLYAQLALLPEARPFLDQLDQFLLVYGERTGDGWGSEVTLRKPTWREQPQSVLSLVARYLSPDLEPPAVAQERNQAHLSTQIDAICAACDDPTAADEFRRQWAYARHCLQVLETHNHYIDQMSTGQLRHAVMAAARYLVRNAVLSAEEDVLWLDFEEILTALRATSPASLAAIVAKRQAEFDHWLEMDSPPILGLPDRTLPSRPPLQDDVGADVGTDEEEPTERIDSAYLRGQGASAGRVRGRARCAPDPAILPDLTPGDILVAHNIGPLWTPIFPLLGGLILESGSLGQHAAATAREYGVPAVINVPHALCHIQDGDWLKLDGAAGTVEFV